MLNESIATHVFFYSEDGTYTFLNEGEIYSLEEGNYTVSFSGLGPSINLDQLHIFPNPFSSLPNDQTFGIRSIKRTIICEGTQIQQIPSDTTLVPIVTTTTTTTTITNHPDPIYNEPCDDEVNQGTCTDDEMALVDAWMNTYTAWAGSLTTDDISYPITLCRAEFCGGIRINVPVEYLATNPIPVPYACIDEIILTEPYEPTIETGGPLFAEVISYYEADADLQQGYGSEVSAPQYNGNIAYIKWHALGKIKKIYGFTYDNMDRMTNALYAHIDVEDDYIFNQHYNVENVAYDRNGNIKRLNRRGFERPCVEPDFIDNLTYQYARNGVQLLSVSDGAPPLTRPQGFTPGEGGTYKYDGNGNMIFDPHKGINIEYNVLNLPKELNGATIWYDADGNKLRHGNRDYVDGIEYVEGAVEAIYHAEGRAVYGFTFSPNSGMESRISESTDLSMEVRRSYQQVAHKLHEDSPKEVDEALRPPTELSMQLVAEHAKFATAALFGDKETAKSHYQKSRELATRLRIENDKLLTALNASDNAASKEELARGKEVLKQYNRSIGDIAQVAFDTDPNTSQGAFRYEYVITDHLGNARVYISDLDRDGTLEVPYDPYETPGAYTEAIQELHYYPFGLEMKGSWTPTIGKPDNYRYNGIEHNEDLNINEAFYRAHDPALGRWWQVDPMAEAIPGITPYNSMLNNPVSFSDPRGDLPPLIIGALIGAGIGGLANGIAHASSVENFFKGFAIGAVAGAATALTGAGVVGAGAFSGALIGAGSGVFGDVLLQFGNGVVFGDQFSGKQLALAGGLGAFGGALTGHFTKAKPGVPKANPNGADDLNPAYVNPKKAGGTPSFEASLEVSATQPGGQFNVVEAIESGLYNGPFTSYKNGVVDLALETLEQGIANGAEMVGKFAIYGSKGMVGETFNRNIFLIENQGTSSFSALKKLVQSIETEAINAGANKISIFGAAVKNEGFLNPRIMSRFGYSFHKTENGIILQKILKFN